MGLVVGEEGLGPGHAQDLAAHGALLLSRRFYEAFARYDFVLIYHLDALVFSDQLASWCAAGYDYIGAPWLVSPDTPHIFTEKVGNGGFSLRSRKFHEAVLKLKVAPSVYSILPEDTLLCRTYKREMEELGIQYAPVGLAMQFSMELPFEDERDVWIGCSFGFHGRFLCHHYGYTYDDLI